MTIPNREAEARAAAEAYADKLFPCTKPCDKFGICEGCSERLIFDSGRAFGRREGMEEAAGIARRSAADYELTSEQTVLHDKPYAVAALKDCAKALRGCEQAIRAAAGEEK